MPDTPNLSSRLTLFYTSIVALILFNGWFLYSNFQAVSIHEQWVKHTADVIHELELLLSSVKDAETNVRGYLLTNNPSYLDDYRRGEYGSWKHFHRLELLTKDNASQQASLQSLSDLLTDRLTLLKKLQTEDRSIFALRESNEVMSQLREQIAQMQQQEQSLYEFRAEAAEQNRSYFQWALLLISGVTLITITAGFFQLRRHELMNEREKLEKSQYAWAQENIAEIAQLLAGDTSVDKASESILIFLASRFPLLAAKIHVHDQGKLNVIAAYGIPKQELHSSQHTNLVLENLKQKRPKQVTEVPDEYWRISSSLGEAKPKALSFIPFWFQTRQLGVIEIGSFVSLSSLQIEQLAQLSETIGIGIHALLLKQQLQQLLEETQLQSEELQMQQEELRTNNEELEQQARAMESQQQTLNIKNQELEGIRHDLETQAEQLQRSSRYKSEFLAKMSHELRTPLNSLMILSTLLTENKEKNLTTQQRQFVQSIHSAGTDLLNLINDILDLSKIEAKKLTLRPEKFTLAEFLNDLYKMFLPQVEAKGLSFQLEFSDISNDIRLFTDRLRLEQVLKNFLSNSMKFTTEGSITLRADALKGRVIITVMDTGIGIAADKQSLIFEAFEQEDSSISRKYGGTGLGLTISRELATILGGDIRLKSMQGQGSEFSICIPLELPSSSTPSLEENTLPSLNKLKLRDRQQELQQNSASAIKHLQSIPTDQKTILIVEDDAHFRSSIVEAAKGYQFYPIEAEDGEVALSILNVYVPSAILLDIKLPGISGLGLLEMIKQMPTLRHVPVHMISALDYQQSALRMGALGYLTKPVTLEKIRSALSRIESLVSQRMKRVLIVEDDERQGLAISELISGDDIQTTSVHTGSLAKTELEKNLYDCIILDLSLPDVTGFELLSQLNSLEVSLPPIVIYTGKDLTSEEEAYLRKFSESIIIKGARSPERLLDEVNLFLHRVESYLPREKKEMLTQLRSQEMQFDGRTILLVDDDLRNLFALTSALEAKGLQVRIAKNGFEAIESLEKYHDIELVLMDIMMPKMDGYEAMRKIRKSANKRLQTLPIVALTAKAMREDHEKCIEAGASDYLPKPIHLQNLMTVLKVWLQSKDVFQ